MLVKGSSSTLVQVTRINNQQVFFEAGDSLGLNQTAAADGTAGELRGTRAGRHRRHAVWLLRYHDGHPNPSDYLLPRRRRPIRAGRGWCAG